MLAAAKCVIMRRNSLGKIGTSSVISVGSVGSLIFRRLVLSAFQTPRLRRRAFRVADSNVSRRS